MKKLLKVGLLGLVLGATAGVASATIGSEETTARPCCSDCDAMYDACIAECGDTSECYTECNIQTRGCYRICSFSC